MENPNSSDPKSPNQGICRNLLKTTYLNFLAKRFVIIGILVLLLLIPISLIENLINKRSSNQMDVTLSLASQWGGRQLLIGPIVAVPFTVSYMVSENVPILSGESLPPEGVNSHKPKEKNQTFKTVWREVKETRWAALTPEKLDIQGPIETKTLYRGIYKALVWTASLNLSGQFIIPEKARFAAGLALEETLISVNWSQARLVMGLSDAKAITSVSQLNLGDRIYDFSPGIGRLWGLPSGFSTPIDLSTNNGPIDFNLTMDFNGSQALMVAPIANENTLTLSSKWPHPSFVGDGLPYEREVTSYGFKAAWKVPALVRTYQNLITLDKEPRPSNCQDNLSGCQNKASIPYEEYTIGVDIIEPVQSQLMSERTIKYAIMFIALTFLVFLISEAVSDKETIKVHIVQYSIIGLALALFYLVLISLSEHIGFKRAYLAATIFDVVLITGYFWAVTSMKKRSLTIGLSITLLYGALFTIISMEDYALLAGTALLAMAIFSLMVITRKIGPATEKKSEN
jgi:inner membrane protein